MPSLRFERIVKAVGDPWAPADANKAPRFAGDMKRVVGVEHFLATLAGVHAQPIAQAAAIVEWTGSAYIVRAQEGLDPAFGIGGVSRLSAGTIEVQLAFDLRTRDHWIAGARGYGTKDPIYGADIGASLKTRRYTRIIIGARDPAKENVWARRDCSFILEVFGDR